MKNINNIKRENIYTLLCFLIPIFVFSIICFNMKIYPFGDRSILTSDMKGQYVNFFSAYRNMLLNGKSLLYSWNAGMGLNFVGVLAYYLSSPITLILIIIPLKYLTEGILLILIIKIGLSGLTFSMYLKYVFKKNNLGTVIFSTIYALMSYNIIYSYNIMWLDGVYLLPIVLIGIERIINKKKPTVLYFSFVILFISNFYIAYMVGLFSMVYFFAAYYVKKESRNVKDFIRSCKVYMITCALSVGATMFLLFPAYFSLKSGQSPFMTNMPGWGPSYNLNQFMSKMFIGSYDTPLNGLPNVYCSILVLILVPLFYLNVKIYIREKLSFTFLLFIMFISMDSKNLNLIWHALHIPNGFPYRYSFLFSFVIIFGAYKTYLNLKYIKVRQVIISYIFISILFIFVKISNYSYLTTANYYMTFVFLTIYALILCIKSRYLNKKSVSVTVMIFVAVFIELIISTNLFMIRIDNMLGFSVRSNYTNFVETYKPIFDYVQSKDRSFYRMEKDFAISHNDPLSLQYNGIASFTSTANQDLNETMNNLGFYSAASLQEMDYNGPTPITDSIFGIKYRVSKEVDSNYYKLYYSNKDANVFKNPYALNIAYLVDKKVNNVQFTDNRFENQNLLLSYMLGKEKTNYFTTISNINIKLNNLSRNIENGEIKYNKINKNEEASIEYNVDESDKSPVFTYLSANQGTEGAKLYIDNKLVDNNYIHYYYKSYIMEIDKNNSAKSKNVKLVLNGDQLVMNNELFYKLNLPNTIDALEKLKSTEFKITKQKSNLIEGTVNASNDKVLFTSIPYDSGWKVTVDGKDAKVNKSIGAFVAVNISKGKHVVMFEFEPKGLNLGIKISIVSILISISIFMLTKIKKSLKEKR